MFRLLQGIRQLRLVGYVNRGSQYIHCEYISASTILQVKIHLCFTMLKDNNATKTYNKN